MESEDGVLTDSSEEYDVLSGHPAAQAESEDGVLTDSSDEEPNRPPADGLDTPPVRKANRDEPVAAIQAWEEEVGRTAAEALRQAEGAEQAYLEAEDRANQRALPIEKFVWADDWEGISLYLEDERVVSESENPHPDVYAYRDEATAFLDAFRPIPDGNNTRWGDMAYTLPRRVSGNPRCARITSSTCRKCKDRTFGDHAEGCDRREVYCDVYFCDLCGQSSLTRGDHLRHERECWGAVHNRLTRTSIDHRPAQVARKQFAYLFACDENDCDFRTHQPQILQLHRPLCLIQRMQNSGAVHPHPRLLERTEMVLYNDDNWEMPQWILDRHDNLVAWLHSQDGEDSVRAWHQDLTPNMSGSPKVDITNFSPANRPKSYRPSHTMLHPRRQPNEGPLGGEGALRQVTTEFRRGAQTPQVSPSRAPEVRKEQKVTQAAAATPIQTPQQVHRAKIEEANLALWKQLATVAGEQSTQANTADWSTEGISGPPKKSEILRIKPPEDGSYYSRFRAHHADQQPTPQETADQQEAAVRYALPAPHRNVLEQQQPLTEPEAEPTPRPRPTASSRHRAPRPHTYALACSHRVIPKLERQCSAVVPRPTTPRMRHRSDDVSYTGILFQYATAEFVAKIYIEGELLKFASTATTNGDTTFDVFYTGMAAPIYAMRRGRPRMVAYLHNNEGGCHSAGALFFTRTLRVPSRLKLEGPTAGSDTILIVEKL